MRGRERELEDAMVVLAVRCYGGFEERLERKMMIKKA
jgi:hypothetical protein